jgi:thiol-disulfide isomerase/thioredoxin
MPAVADTMIANPAESPDLPARRLATDLFVFHRVRAKQRIRVLGWCLLAGFAALAGPGSAASSDAKKVDPFSMDQPNSSFFDQSGKELTKAEFKRLTSLGVQYNVDHKSGAVIFRIYTKAELEAFSKKLLHPISKTKIGDTLPLVDTTMLDGTRFRSADLRGHVTLINFFFTTCPPCIAEAPTLSLYAKSHPEMKVIAATYDSREDARHFAVKQKFSWPIIVDAKTWLDEMGVELYPLMALVDGDGRLVVVNISSELKRDRKGVLDVADIERWVAKNRPGKRPK